MIQYVLNKNKAPSLSQGAFSQYGAEAARAARRFHSSFPEYFVTPLASLASLASRLGVAGIYVKDESYRFGLNAFKVLGGSYAIGKIMEKTPGEHTFITATDGNHGRGVAWAASRLGMKSVVYMPKGTAQERLDNIRALGSDASITDLSYDDAVRKACADAEANGWILVQDTSFAGYEEVPSYIMQGYTTMALEAVEQLGDFKPTHVFLQAGVGSMAGAVTAFLADYYGAEHFPTVTIVEPNTADCMYLTAQANDGALHSVPGEMHTIMAGLACGEPCPLAWEILNCCASAFVSMQDEVAANGMRALAAEGIVSGESGASGFGFALELLTNSALSALKEALGIDEHSVILCFSTEGATDRENYAKIVNG